VVVVPSSTLQALWPSSVPQRLNWHVSWLIYEPYGLHLAADFLQISLLSLDTASKGAVLAMT
jgi:hypothetical protein